MASRSNLPVVIGELREFVEERIKAIVINSVANLKSEPPLGTPVDTGWARANWVPGIGAPPTTPAPNPSASSDWPRGPAGGGSAEAASNAGVATVATQYKLSMGPVFIVNNVPYLVKLNDGYSVQSPIGFIQAAILKAVEDSR